MSCLAKVIKEQKIANPALYNFIEANPTLQKLKIKSIRELLGDIWKC